MATPTTLYDYYTQQGKSLPSLQERSQLYTSSGFGGTYIGSAQQNTSLLQKLLSAPTTTSTSTAPISSPATNQSTLNYSPYVPPASSTPAPNQSIAPNMSYAPASQLAGNPYQSYAPASQLSGNPNQTLAAPTTTAPKMATLINASGQKVVVPVGSQEAQRYFSQGYTLMGATPTAPTGTPSYSPTPSYTPPSPSFGSTSTSGGTSTINTAPGAPSGLPSTQPAPNLGSQSPTLGLAATGTGATPYTGDPNRRAQIDALTKAILAAMQPGAEEVGTQQGLSALEQAERQRTLDAQGKPVALPFIRGDEARIAKQAAIEKLPLIEKLAMLQAQRQALLQATQAERGFLSEEEKAELERYSPKEVGGALVQLNPETGKYETAYRAPATQEGFTLSPGEQRFDAQGNPIAGVAATPKTEAQPAGVQEYEYAKQQGYTGDYLDFIKAKSSAEKASTGELSAGSVDSWVKLLTSGQAKFSDIPSDLQNQVAMGLAAAPTGTTPQAKRALEQAGVALTSIDQALTLLPKTGPALTRVAASKLPGTDSFQFSRYLDTVKALIGFDQLQKMREASPTGGALGQVSDREINFLQSVAGSLDIGQKTEHLMETLQRIQQSFQALQSINVQAGLTPATATSGTTDTGGGQWDW